MSAVHQNLVRSISSYVFCLSFLACTEAPSSTDAAVDAGIEDSQVSDGAHDADLDGPLEDAPPDGPSCEPFAESAPPPVSLGACGRTLEREALTPETRTISGVNVRSHIAFAARGDYTLHGDLRLPDREGRTGALLIVHGGGWLDCDNRRDSVDFFAQAFAEVLGIPTFNVDYRLAQEGGGYPENVMDIKCAIQWLRANGDELGIDPARIGVFGTSAGAHLALMTGLTSDREDLDPRCADEPTDVSLVLSYAGPTDLPRFVRSESIAREAPLYYTGETCEVEPACIDARACDRCSDASPLSHACRPKETQFVLLQAPDPYDRFVAQVQAELLFGALRDAGNRVELRIPTDAEMRAAGCTPEAGSHAADGCMIQASQDLVNPLIIERLGPRSP